MSGNGRDDERDPPAAEDQADGTPTDRPDETSLVGVDADPRRPLTRDEVESLRRENEELRDQLLRRRADFDNYRKRVERDRQEMGTEAVASLLRELLPSLDNLDRALEAGGDAEALRGGVELIRRDLLAVLESQGVTVEDPTGLPFDPLRHQALSHDPAPGVPEGTVVSVLRRGYSFRDRLLRPALVTVAKGSEAGTEPGSKQVH